MQFGFTAAAAATTEGTKRGRVPCSTVKRAGFRPEEVNQPGLVIVGIWLDPDEARRTVPLRTLYATLRPLAICEFVCDCGFEGLSLEIDKEVEIVIVQIGRRNGLGSLFCFKRNIEKLMHFKQHFYKFNHWKTNKFKIVTRYISLKKSGFVISFMW